MLESIPSRHRELAAIALLLAGVAAWLGVLETLRPYYFLWDDNASYYLPCYTYNYRTVIEHGTLPHLNYHQYLGYTYLASGQTSVLYPPVYAALLAARWGWGDLRPTIDLLAALHFVLAAVGMFFLLRRLAADRTTSALGALMWVTFPFLAQVARNWIFVSYAAAWVPWSLFLLDRLAARPAPGRLLALAVVKALFLVQGYVQYAVLATLYEGLYLLARWGLSAAGRSAWRRQGLAYAGAVLASLFLAAPMLVPMLQAKELSAYRSSALGYDEFLSNALDLRTFLSAQLFHMEPRAIHLATGALFFAGLPNLLALIAAAGPAIRRLAGPRWAGPRWAGPRDASRFAVDRAVVPVIPAIAALVLAGPGWGLVYSVPVLSSFRWPFKSFLFFLAFLVPAVVGLCRRLQENRRLAWLGPAILALGVALNVTVMVIPGFDVPFGPNRVDEDVSSLRQRLGAPFPPERGRVVSLYLSPREPRIHRFLIFNYATLSGAHHLGGYEPLVARLNLDLARRLEYSNIFRYRLEPPLLEHLSRWSVRYFIVPDYPQLRRYFEPHPQLRPIAHSDGVAVFENGGAWPLASFVGPQPRPVPVTWEINGVRLATGGRGGLVRLGIAPLAGYVWTADGQDMGGIAVGPDDQVLLDVPAGTREVAVRYVDVPFLVGAGLFWAFVASWLAAWLLRRRRAGAGASVPGVLRPGPLRRRSRKQT